MHPHATPPPAAAATSQPSPPQGTAARSATNLVVHHLYSRIGDEDLRRAFARFGAVVSAAVEREIDTGKSRQMGFVNFATHEAARAAVAEMHHCKRCGLGKKITVRWASACHNVRERAEERAQSCELFVRNVPLDVTAEQLAECVAWLGPVLQVRLCGDTVPSETAPRQIAFVTFGSAGAAQQALRHLHCQRPFASCGGVPLLCKLKEEYARVRRGSVESDASAQPVTSFVASDSSTSALPSLSLLEGAASSAPLLYDGVVPLVSLPASRDMVVYAPQFYWGVTWVPFYNVVQDGKGTIAAPTML